MPAAMAARGDPSAMRRAVEDRRAGVGDVEAREHLHERGLAGAVLAEQAVQARRPRRSGLTPSLARTGPKCLWMSRSSRRHRAPDASTVGGSWQPNGPSVSRPSPSGRVARRLAGALDALEQLRRVPDLRVGRGLALGEVRRAVLVVERAGPQVDRAVGQAGDELVEQSLRPPRSGPGPSTQPTAVVSGLLMSAQSGPSHWKVASNVPSITALRDLQVRRPPIEVRHAQADIRGPRRRRRRSHRGRPTRPRRRAAALPGHGRSPRSCRCRR